MGIGQRLLASARDLVGGLVLVVSLVASSTSIEAQLLPTTEASRERPGVPAGPPLIPGVRLDLQEEYYEVREETLNDVARQLNGMRLQGPEAPPSQGLTTYHIRPSWNALARGGRCHVRNAEVFVDILITLPRWPGVFDRPVREREAWASIDRAIREHEYQHRDLIVEAAGALLEQIRDMDAQGCTVLRRSVSSAVSVAGERLDRANEALDAGAPRRLSIGVGDRR